MAKRVERLRSNWYAFAEPACWKLGHEDEPVETEVAGEYLGSYCTRCGAHWNHAVDDDYFPSNFMDSVIALRQTIAGAANQTTQKLQRTVTAVRKKTPSANKPVR